MGGKTGEPRGDSKCDLAKSPQPPVPVAKGWSLSLTPVAPTPPVLGPQNLTHVYTGVPSPRLWVWRS